MVKMRKKSYWMPTDLDDAIVKYSEATKLSQSDIVRVATTKYLYDHPLIKGGK